MTNNIIVTLSNVFAKFIYILLVACSSNEVVVNRARSILNYLFAAFYFLLFQISNVVQVNASHFQTGQKGTHPIIINKSGVPYE